MGAKTLSTNVLSMVAVVLWAASAAPSHAQEAESAFEGIWLLNQDLSDTARAQRLAIALTISADAVAAEEDLGGPVAAAAAADSAVEAAVEVAASETPAVTGPTPRQSRPTDRRCGPHGRISCRPLVG